MWNRFPLQGSLAAALLSATWLQFLATASPTVDVALKASFSSPPYLVELLETAAQENETSYFALLDRIAQGTFAEANTDQSLYETFLEVLQHDGHITSPGALSTFKLALSLRTAAPRIEAHYQHYATAIEPLLPDGQGGCEQWLLVGGRQCCEPIEACTRGKTIKDRQDRHLAFDRGLGGGAQDIILYADITSPSFAEFHARAAEAAQRGEASYRVRYKRSPSSSTDALPVNGYGVELALKRTDYIVVDDRESGSDTPMTKENKDIGAEVVLDQEEELADLRPLEKSDLSSLGLKAASFIMESDSPFTTLVKLTQDFPKYSSSIAAHNVSADFETELEASLGQAVRAGVNMLWMNGVQLADRQVQPFSMVDMLRRERKLINDVMDLGMTGEEAVSLLGHSELATASGKDEPPRFDWRDDTEEGRAIIWLNNIEQDKRYAEFPKSLMALLQPSMSGQLPQVRRDIFNLVVPVDLSQLEDLQLVVGQLLGFVQRLVPIRFGLVPLTSSTEAAEQAKIAYHLAENYGLSALAEYLGYWVEREKTPKSSEAIFEQAIKDARPRAESAPVPFGDIATSEGYEERIRLARQWNRRLHADTDVPPVFFNGHPIPREQGWLAAMQQQLGQDLRSLQEGLFYRSIDEDMWIPELFLKNAMKRRNLLISPHDPDALNVVNINKLIAEHQALFARLPVLEAEQGSPKDDWAALTVIADLDNGEGRKLLLHALQFRRDNPGVRLDIIHNPADATPSPSLVCQQMKAHQHSLSQVQLLSDLEAVLDDRVGAEAASDYDAALARFLASTNIGPGDSMLVLNGRVIGPVASAEDFGEDDFQQFLDAERDARILPVYRALADLGLGDKISTPLDAAKLTSVTTLSTMSDVPAGIFDSGPSSRTTAYRAWASTHTGFEVGDASKATVFLVAVLDPASELGQRWASILKTLSRVEDVHLKVFLNPRDGLSELPVKRFYRYVLDPAPTFDASGRLKALSATFAGIPSEALLTVGMDVPPAWLVSSKVAVDDLDNLKLGEIKSRRNADAVEAVYELEHILVEGHSRQVPGGGPPRGVQLVLASEKDPHFADTIIMANLGYFQFKANPGVYSIRLEEGRSSDIFAVDSVGASGWKPVPGDEGTEVVLMDFQGITLFPRLRRRPGMERADVLEEGTAGGAGGLVSKGLKLAGGILGKAKDPAVVARRRSEAEHAEINIFSVASGHLYERMLNIMMVSVMRHTNHTVKFWFIEQFLSPSFKDFIPTMAAEYGFRYEMVTFKWPHWLRQQTEKQREIWGYKILFLDVLFPLSLDKVIFVDADQIVRTDMYDLVELDLEGAPYGFTPMCDSRVEMEGFRFWKQGYWARYLRGLPYHISALYVVDLRRFRELAAGDRLRQQYHSLSADPASLSNLDQDLPNHMQFAIPIRSLPQEWLWCETWCSDDTLRDARTIDLCNNPLTKEPKLDRARRQVPEWTEYDDEIAALDRRRRAAAAAARVPPGEAAPADAAEEVRLKDEL